jgi:hypothetical protein
VFSFGPDAGTGEVDGTIDGKVAIEIGVGSPKQVRASALDLIFHPFPKKLLIVVDTPGHTSERTAVQAATILLRAGCSGVVYRLPREGSGDDRYQVDLARVVNKYIGETEKNLVRVFDAVDHVDMVLSSDGGDRVLGRRDE